VLEADACKYTAPPLNAALLPLKLESSIALSVLSKEIAPPYPWKEKKKFRMINSRGIPQKIYSLLFIVLTFSSDLLLTKVQ
jgi:hypothetical protein